MLWSGTVFDLIQILKGGEHLTRVITSVMSKFNSGITSSTVWGGGGQSTDISIMRGRDYYCLLRQRHPLYASPNSRITTFLLYSTRHVTRWMSVKLRSLSPLGGGGSFLTNLWVFMLFGSLLGNVHKLREVLTRLEEVKMSKNYKKMGGSGTCCRINIIEYVIIMEYKDFYWGF